jgi:predicted anti-sigma-YlaC factor YlaD
MKSQDCESARELLSALIDEQGEQAAAGGVAHLSERERQAAEMHLGQCAACREWIEQVRHVRIRLAAYPRIEPAPGFNAAVIARVTAHPLARLADALDRLICTPARQFAAGVAAALVLSTLAVWLALHVAVVSAPAPPPPAGEIASVPGTFYEDVRPPSPPPRRHPPGPPPFEAEQMRELQRLGER